jgi:hypothetical protein
VATWIDVMRPSGRDFPLQPHFGVNRIANWSPSVTNTITAEGLPAASVGTVSHPTLTATNLAARMRRRRPTSAEVVDSAADQRSAGWACWRGNTAGSGGWTCGTRISLTMLQATGMGFFGPYGSTLAFVTTPTYLFRCPQGTVPHCRHAPSTRQKTSASGDVPINGLPRTSSPGTQGGWMGQ